MTRCAAARAIALLVAVRDELELAARPPGEIVTISRQATESMIDELRAAARLIRELTESVS
jgi:hypothetical protein